LMRGDDRVRAIIASKADCGVKQHEKEGSERIAGITSGTHSLSSKQS